MIRVLPNTDLAGYPDNNFAGYRMIMLTMMMMMIIDYDVDEAYEAATEYGIRSVPTVVLVKDGVEINRFTGMSSKMAYVNAINEGLK